MAKYTAYTETLAADLSSFVAFELAPELREVFTASGDVKVGDVVTGTVGSGEAEVTLYGIAAGVAASGQEYPVVCRNAVIIGTEFMADAAKKALVEQGCRII